MTHQVSLKLKQLPCGKLLMIQENIMNIIILTLIHFNSEP